MKKTIEENGHTIAKEYAKLKVIREPFLQAAKEAARLSIPSIAPDENPNKVRNHKRTISTPNQSVTADGVNNLAAKVVLTLMPPNQTFFKFKVDKVVLEEEAAKIGEETETYADGINKGLANLESILLDYIESSSDRVCAGEAFKHLFVTGNVLLVGDYEKGLKFYPLSRFVVKRDYCGNPIKVITEEIIVYSELPKDLQDKILAKYVADMAYQGENPEERIDDKEFTLYTKYQRKRNRWEVLQEVDGFVPEETKGEFPLDVMPIIPLRYVRVDGEDYGRGLIEDYYGDISYLDTLSLSIKEAALAGSKLLMLVRPSGMTNIRKISKAKNGDFVEGDINDVSPLQANKYYDLQTAYTMADKIEKRLNRIFCMKAAIQRDAERVTAEEIREMAADLEEAHGNYYSLMAKEFQSAYVKLKFWFLRKAHKEALPNLLDDNSIKLTITTGLEALGRTSDLNKWTTFFNVIASLAQSAQAVGAKTDKLISVVATSLNLDVTGMFYTEEEKQAMQAQQAQAEMMNRAAPNIVNKVGDAYLQQQEQEGAVNEE